MEGQDEYKAGHTGSALDRAVQWALAYITTNPLNMQTKLESIEQGAQKNPSYLKDGRYILDMSTVYYAPASDGLYFGGEAVNGSYSGFSIKMPLASKTAAGVMSKEDKRKLDNIAIDLSLFEGVGKSLPTINAIFTHRGMMTHHRSVYTPDGDFQHIFCCEHDKDYSESQKGHLYIVFADNGLEYVTSYDTSDDYTVAPDYILRAFGEANATKELDGTMSAADKIKLDALKEAVELPTTSGTSFVQSNIYTIGGKLVADIAYYTESIIQPVGIVKHYCMAAYMGGKYYKYYQGRTTTGKPTFDYSDTFTEANVPSDIASLFHASTTQSGLMSADDKALLNEHSILLNDFKIRTFSMEVDVDGNEIRGYEGTIGTFHVKEGESFKVKDLADQPMKLSGTITSSDGFIMTFNSLNPAVADKDYYGTFTIKLPGKYKVAVSLV